MYFYYLYISSPITEIQNGNDCVSKENTPSSKKGKNKLIILNFLLTD